MTKILLGSLPEGLEVQLVRGDGAVLAASLVDSDGASIDWPAPPVLEFARKTSSTGSRTVVSEHVAGISGDVATWTLSEADVEEVWAGTLSYGVKSEAVARLLV